VYLGFARELREHLLIELQHIRIVVEQQKTVREHVLNWSSHLEFAVIFT
jgi:hypothetical protein